MQLGRIGGQEGSWKDKHGVIGAFRGNDTVQHIAMEVTQFGNGRHQVRVVNIVLDLWCT